MLIATQGRLNLLFIVLLFLFSGCNRAQVLNEESLPDEITGTWVLIEDYVDTRDQVGMLSGKDIDKYWIGSELIIGKDRYHFPCSKLPGCSRIFFNNANQKNEEKYRVDNCEKKFWRLDKSVEDTSEVLHLTDAIVKDLKLGDKVYSYYFAGCTDYTILNNFYFDENADMIIVRFPIDIFIFKRKNVNAGK